MLRIILNRMVNAGIDRPTNVSINWSTDVSVNLVLIVQLVWIGLDLIFIGMPRIILNSMVNAGISRLSNVSINQSTTVSIDHTVSLGRINFFIEMSRIIVNRMARADIKYQLFDDCEVSIIRRITMSQFPRKSIYYAKSKKWTTLGNRKFDQPA
jgi:hypothetical protein